MSAKKTVLLVEDEPEFRQALRIRLEANGYDVIEAEDGERGLELARNANPDLIVLDIMLPKMDGYKMARLLKFDEKHRRLPILVLTARSQQSDKETAMSVGADAYLTKPFDPNTLLASIAELIGKGEEDGRATP